MHALFIGNKTVAKNMMTARRYLCMYMCFVIDVDFCTVVRST